MEGSKTSEVGFPTRLWLELPLRLKTDGKMSDYSLLNKQEEVYNGSE